MSATATATATEEKDKAALPSKAVNELFREALLSYEKALESGVQLQEESVAIWKGLLGKLGSPDEFQAKLEALNSNVFPASRRRLEEFVETFNRTSNQTLDLFEKSLGIYQATSITEAQGRIQELLEASLTTLRVNVHTVLNTNAKIMTSWKELADRFGPTRKEFSPTNPA
jgi:hypothetical protein